MQFLDFGILGPMVTMVSLEVKDKDLKVFRDVWLSLMIYIFFCWMLLSCNKLYEALLAKSLRRSPRSKITLKPGFRNKYRHQCLGCCRVVYIPYCAVIGRRSMSLLPANHLVLTVPLSGGQTGSLPNQEWIYKIVNVVSRTHPITWKKNVRASAE